MNAAPEVIHVVRQWLNKAEEDFTTAQYLLTLKEKCPFGIVTFHAQQCAEKYLKSAFDAACCAFPQNP
jgi:HEPN domain-containing protein